MVVVTINTGCGNGNVWVNSVNVARQLGDYCVVMDDGKVVWNGTMQTLADDSVLQARLMGLAMEVE